MDDPQCISFKLPNIILFSFSWYWSIDGSFCFFLLTHDHTLFNMLFSICMWWGKRQLPGCGVKSHGGSMSWVYILCLHHQQFLFAQLSSIHLDGSINPETILKPYSLHALTNCRNFVYTFFIFFGCRKSSAMHDLLHISIEVCAFSKRIAINRYT